MNWKTLGQIGDDRGERDAMPCYMLLVLVLVPDAAPQSRFRFTVKVPNYPVSPCCRVLHILDLSGMRSVKGTLGIPWQQNESQIQWLEKVMNCGSRAHGFSDLRPGVVFAHFAPIINGTPSSTHPAFPPAMKHIKQLLPSRAQTPGLQQPCTAWTRVWPKQVVHLHGQRPCRVSCKSFGTLGIHCKVLPFWVKTFLDRVFRPPSTWWMWWAESGQWLLACLKMLV